VAAFAAAKWTGSGTWLAIAELTGFINLFNLIPFFGLDGSHGIKVLSRGQRLAVVAAFAVAWQVSGVQLILLPLAVTIWRAFARETGRGDARTLANFLGLIAVLTWLAALKTV
jgi:Zn-dependent protease